MKIQRLVPLPIIAALTALLCAPVPASAQSILGTAGNFALLGGTTITSTGSGPSISNGDVGSYAISGSYMITNGTEVTTDPTLSNALADLTKAANGLAGMTATTDLSAINGGSLGGQTLLPGVYKFDSAENQTLNTTLTLNANGQNDVFWVFQVSSTITFGANDNVVITNPGTNGGSDDGIFWVAESGAVNFGANDQVLGNFLADTSIAFGSSDAFNGSALAHTSITSLDNTDNADVLGGPPEGNDWAGGLMFSGSSVVPNTVPEPAAFLWLAPLGAIGFAIWRRRAGTNKIAA